jgi:hypothetical protein
MAIEVNQRGKTRTKLVERYRIIAKGSDTCEEEEEEEEEEMSI